MKILITGASGKIAQMLIKNLKEFDLILWSRNASVFVEGGGHLVTRDLYDCEWWSEANIPEGVDIVIHLAEVVKEKLDPVSVNKIICSHSAFLRRAAAHARIVIYPDTAYKYDEVLSGGNKMYLLIKISVLKLVNDLPNVVSPVIHPVVDMSGALSRIIYLQSRLPLVNIFCDFNSTLPFLTKYELLANFRKLISVNTLSKSDWYSKSKTISDLMSVERRLNVYFVSKVIKFILHFFIFLPPIALILNGRKVPAKSESKDLIL